MNWDEFTRQWRELRSRAEATVRSAVGDGSEDGERRERVVSGSIQAHLADLVDDDGEHIKTSTNSSSQNPSSKSNNEKVE